MTIDDAIYLIQEKANEQKDRAILYDTHPALLDRVEDYKASAENYEQIVTWLKHYKEILAILAERKRDSANYVELSDSHYFQKILNIFEEEQ